MNYWRQADGTKSVAVVQTADGRVLVETGTWPVRSDVAVWIAYNVRSGPDSRRAAWSRAESHINGSPTCSWRANLGPFRAGDMIEYAIISRSADRESFSPWFTFRVGQRPAQHRYRRKEPAGDEPVACTIGGHHALR
ncbi:MAG: hypothetical protein PCFJNLEI_01186 [Verrucomicrobiae bacterium]|nr:hypothetical protein [Verrucomicrobiae bacterium]